MSKLEFPLLTKLANTPNKPIALQWNVDVQQEYEYMLVHFFKAVKTIPAGYFRSVNLVLIDRRYQYSVRVVT